MYIISKVQHIISMKNNCYVSKMSHKFDFFEKMCYNYNVFYFRRYGGLRLIMKSELKRKAISLSITLLVVMTGVLKNNLQLNIESILQNNNTLAYESKLVYNIDDDLNSFIEENKNTFEFYSTTFGISIDDIKQEIITNNNGKVLDKNDIFNTGTIDNLDKSLINYLTTLEKKNSKLFKRKSNNGNDFNKKYVYGLINYFSNIYDNVDYETLAGIAYIESGNLNSKYMMSSNNVYGGMSSHGLIKHISIEYGILSYVRMMSSKYYGKGLNTIAKINKVYAPGNTSWTGKVTAASHKFINQEKITSVDELIDLK